MDMERVKAVFAEAMALGSAGKRTAFLDQACAGEPDVRAEVEAMLAAEVEAGDFLENPLFAPRTLDPLDGIGSRIGPYHILEPIGEGGFGMVYLAEQEEPMRRRVALKIIKAGMDTKQVIARFEAERQALALMDHPNIARVFEAGATSGGRPYFVMELVPGIKVTEFCERAEMSTEERLRLFIQVCHAVQHAHQKGVIHRDLKPSNILVARQDSVPVPKVIDFGIAKAAGDRRLTHRTLLTAFDQFLGTPAYMSPEQADLNPAGAGDVDTRTDIYSLGVLLYELLTGSTPFETRELTRASLDEMRRIIREREPVRPSTRLARLRQRASPQPETREAHSGPRTPNLEIESDLDWIVMKCLEKDRARRYATANGLAADLERYLANEPVVARPPSTSYQIQKAFRRHRVAFSAGLAVAMSLLAALAVSLWMTVQARRARDNATIAHRLAEQQLYVSSLREARLAWENNNFARLRQILAETRNHPDRGFEWSYWQRQAHLELKTLRGHLAPVIAVAFSPDGSRIVTGSFDRTARVWDADQGTQWMVLRGHDREVRAVCFAPDGQSVLTASADKTARIWDISTGTESRRFEGHTGWLTSAAFSPDGRLIATGSYDGTARIWDVHSGKALRTLVHPGLVWSVAFSRDSRRVLTSCGDESATLWEVATGTPLTVIRAPSTRIASRGEQGSGTYPFTAIFSSDGRRIITGSRDQVTRVWDLASSEERVPPLKGPSRWWPPTKADVPFCLAVDPHGQWVVTGGLDRTAPVWSLTDRTSLFTHRGHEAEVAAVAVSPDGRHILTGSYDHTAKIWDATKRPQFVTLKGHSESIVSVAYSRDGLRIVTGSWDKTAKVWSATDGDLLQTLAPGTKRIWSVGFSADGRQVITGGDDGIPRIWEVATGENILNLPELPSSVTVGFFPDGHRVLVGTGEGQVLVWDSVTRRFEFKLKEDFQLARAAVSPDGRWIVTVSNPVGEGTGGHRILKAGPDGVVRAHSEGSVQVWDAATARRRFALVGHTASVSTAAFSLDSRLIVTGGFDGTPRVWDALTGREKLRLEGHTDRVVFAAFTPDMRRIVTSSFDDTTRVWDADNGQELLTITEGFALALSPDGRSIVIAGPPPARELTIATDQEVARWAQEERQAREAIEAERRELLAAKRRIESLGLQD